MKADELLTRQRTFFATGKTLSISCRKQALKKLRQAIEIYEKQLFQALKQDLGKSQSESYMSEIGLVKSEISYMLRHLSHFAKEKRVHTPLAQMFSRSFEKPSPYGNVLILSPWNYPFLLTIEPLVDVLAAGNIAILKPSGYSPQTSLVIKEMIESCFDQDYVAVVTGGRNENNQLLALNFDYIFFTGSKKVGRMVMEKAALHLTPITLELGGKSPCIVDRSANIPLAAKRIVFGKFLNCGQTCVAPDYIYCQKSIKDALVSELKKQIRLQYGQDPLHNADYGKIVNEKHFQRLTDLIDEKKVVAGGKNNQATLQIEPTLLDNVIWQDSVMADEIFGPILPILTFDTLEEIIQTINAQPSPLALYIFSSNRQNINVLKNRIAFGGGCINDVLIHLATSHLGFGGVKESAMGAYHGRYCFETFSHKKSMVDKKTILDLPMRYQPYTKWKAILVRLFVR